METKLNLHQEEPEGWELWLDTGVVERDGLIIGLGHTAGEAIDSALKELTEATSELNRMKLQQMKFP
jgi:hypothetical protein